MSHDNAEVVHGDNVEIMRGMQSDCVDSIVTDPPAGIGFMGKDWDSDKGGRDEWIAWLAGVMREALRVLKPGGHALVWAIPRTSGWTQRALEDAGFEIRDVVTHLFGTGFPKSLNVGKALACDGGGCGYPCPKCGGGYGHHAIPDCDGAFGDCTCPTSVEHLGQGTALKPGAEFWILARKPLVGTVAKNVAQFGTGGLNIDGCRIGDAAVGWGGGGRGASDSSTRNSDTTGLKAGVPRPVSGRWPANVVLDEEAAAELDAQSGTLKSGSLLPHHVRTTSKTKNAYGERAAPVENIHGDSGGASRFFYVAKAGRRERDAGCEHLPAKSGGGATDREDGSAGIDNPRAGAGRGGGRKNHHPTVKSVALMRWLCRLITPPGGLVLDPFAGSGSTGLGALAEGFSFLGIEQEAEYVRIAEARLAHALLSGAET